jgi:hypothetical protein
METTPSELRVMSAMPNISRITLDTELLLECVRQWELRDFKGEPPEPRIVAFQSQEQSQVTIMANFVRFRRDKPKRDADKLGGYRLEDI